MKEEPRPFQLPGPLLQALLGAPAAAAAYRPPPEHAALLARFAAGEAPALFCYTATDGPEAQLHVATAVPRRFRKLLYLLRAQGRKAPPSGGAPGSAVPSPPAFTAGFLDGQQPMRPLHDLLFGLYAPHLQPAADAWPEGLRADWADALHGFGAALTEAAAAAEGRTALYVPQEAEASDAVAAARQRDLVQRLEVRLLRWTAQVRGVLGGSVARELAGQAAVEEGPAEEAAFWRTRAADLGSLQAQLEAPALARLLRVLEAAKSPHLPAFLEARGRIAAQAQQAASNLAWLAALEEPCAALAAAAPPQIHAALAPVLDALRLVWTLSPHYNTPDQLAGMLRRVGTAVVAHCRAALDLPALLAGRQLEAAEQALQQCCDAAAGWRAAYSEAAARVSAALPTRPWDFGAALLFAHLDAFVQRCHDLQEVCAAQRQFGAMQMLTPVVGGPRAAEVERAVGEVQAGFAAQMGRLQQLPYDPLDVRRSEWYTDMASFRAATRDLEQQLAGILASAAAQAASLPARLDIIEAFAQTATRDGLRKAVEAQAALWHQAFLGELAAAKRAFEGLKAALPEGAALPQYSGRMLVLRGMLRSIERSWDHLQALASADRLPLVPKAAESASAYEALHMGMQQYANTLHMEWYGSIPFDLGTQLQHNLLRQDRAAGGLLHLNLSPQLAAALEESYIFDRQRDGVPGAAQDLLPERQRLRTLVVGVQAVAAAYNGVLEGLPPADRRLCRDRIRFLDRRVLPGVNKLSWASPPHQAAFCQKDALRCCKEAAAVVAELHAANAAVARTAALFRDSLLLRAERKRLFDLPDFEQRQRAHLADTTARLAEAHASLRTALVSLWARFAGDSEEVAAEWLAWLRRADQLLLEALTACVRRSLLEVARVVQGEHNGAELSPVFVLGVILDTNGRVELKPTLQQLFDTVHGTCSSAVAALEALPRLVPEVLSSCGASGALPACLRDVEAPPTYAAAVGQSEDAVAKQMQAITAGISSIVDKVQQVLSFYEKKYQQSLWQTDCTAYMRRYERANKPVAAFMADIQKYLDLREEVLSEDSASNVRWLRLGATTLKQQLTSACDTWVAAFSGLLATLASRQLSGLEEELSTHCAALEAGGLQQEGGGAAGLAGGAGQAGDEQAAAEEEAGAQGAGVEDGAAAAGEASPAAALTREQRFEALEALHGRLLGEREALQERLAVCQERYEALVGLQVSLPDGELERVDALPAQWERFVAALESVPARLRALCD